MSRFLVHLLVSGLSLAVTAWILPGVNIGSPAALLVAALVLGLINAVLKPLLVILTFPITLLSLGLFYFVLNALLFALAAWLVPGFDVAGFWWALLGTLVFGLFSSFIGAQMGMSGGRVHRG